MTPLALNKHHTETFFSAAFAEQHQDFKTLILLISILILDDLDFAETCKRVIQETEEMANLCGERNGRHLEHMLRA